VSGSGEVTRWLPRTCWRAAMRRSRVRPRPRKTPPSAAMARRRCSTLRYSSLSARISSSALVRSCERRCVMKVCDGPAAGPDTCGRRASSRSTASSIALEEEQRLVPQRVGHLAQARRHAGLALPQTRGATAAAHLEREMGGHRVALAHTELVVGAGRAPLGLDVVRDAGQPEAALAPPERGALAVADEDHGPGFRFHHLLHPVTSAARRVGGL